LSESESPKQNQFTRKKLTPFLAHEMIYDYAAGQLDPERRAALEEFLAKDTESQNILKNIEQAKTYTEKLRGLSVDREILQQLQEAESAVSLGKRYSSWKEWPETLRWSITAVAMSAVVAGTVALVPWSKISPSKKSGGVPTLEVAQIPQSKTEAPAEVAANEENGSGDEAPDEANDESSGDDVGDEGDSSTGATAVAAAAAIPKKPTPTATPAAVARATPPTFVTVNLPQPTPPNGAKPTSTPAPGTNASTKLAITQTADSHAPGDAKARGFVYRAFMTLDNLDELGPKITADINALGAEKAGEVELGWKRGSGRYYHFAIPEENEKKVMERLQVYGPVRISKDPHPRVMPPGKVRFILWIESAGDPSSPPN
jgi:hypothetical protein